MRKEKKVVKMGEKGPQFSHYPASLGSSSLEIWYVAKGFPSSSSKVPRVPHDLILEAKYYHLSEDHRLSLPVLHTCTTYFPVSHMT